MKPADDVDLLQAYLDGTLSADQVQAIEARLKAEPGFAQLLIRLGREEGVLSEWARSQRTVRLTPTLRRPVPIRVWMIRAAAVLLIAAALGALLFTIPWNPETPAPTLPVATLEEVQGDVFVVTPTGNTVAAVPGQELFSGQTVRTSDDSAAVVRYPDQTRVELGADTLVSLLFEAAAKKINLTEGVLIADVVRQPAGRPMVLTTPHVEVRAQETRFSSTTVTNLTRLDPEEGLLQVTRRSDSRSVEVPGGSYLVAAVNDDVPGARPFTPQFLPARLKQPRAVLRDLTGPLQPVGMSPNGQTIAIGGGDGVVRLWDMIPPERAPTFLGVRWGSVHVPVSEARAMGKGFARGLRTVAFAPDGKTVAAASDEKSVRVWDTMTGDEQAAYKCRVTAITFLPDGTLVTVGGANKIPAEIKLWKDGREEALAMPIQREALCVAASPDGNLIAVGFTDGTVRLWDLVAGQELRTWQAHAKEVRCLAFAPDGKTLASGGRDQLVYLWDTMKWVARDLLPGHPGEVRVLTFSPDGQTLVSGGGNGMLKVWNPTTGEEMAAFRADKHGVGGLAFSPDGRTLVTSGRDRTIKLWDTR
jgi:WD40 repeat protein